ncbi:MAG: 2-oxoglutarate dehydrogenase E1 component [Chlamydiia bacterium]|nr:2-oxoglutarate dehydrogenase E1 component [Chlamydiia bacterium]
MTERRKEAIDHLNFGYIEGLYQQYLQSPQSVDPSWIDFFQGFEMGARVSGSAPDAQATQSSTVPLIAQYQRHGHLLANSNPLVPPLQELPQMADADGGLESLGQDKLSLRLKELYCSQIGYQFEHITDSELKQFIAKRITERKVGLESSEKKNVAFGLMRAELFEVFLHRNHQGQIRFSLEGGETLIPMLQHLLERAADEKLAECAMGMAHRGRLNVLANILQKPLHQIFHQFEKGFRHRIEGASGDVKYHSGYSTDLEIKNHRIKATLLDNPSHLETVDAVLLGFAKQRQQNRSAKDVLPILMHGDAAFSGQGIVYETLQMGRLRGYRTGGTIHIVINNQVGYTANPYQTRSTPYPTDIGLSFDLPIFHVNTNDPEGAVYVMDLAFDIRQKFGVDVLINFNCYRKHGHNESDEPQYTQPLLYKTIKQTRSPYKHYIEALEAAGEWTKEDQATYEGEYKELLEAALQETKEFEASSKEYMANLKKGCAINPFAPVETEISAERLDRYLEVLNQFPPDFDLHPKLKKQIEARAASTTLDWATCELAAYASLLDQDIPVRMTGQDCIRGTFSHRHAGYWDQTEQNLYIPLNHMKEGGLEFKIFNSLLSEYGALGFEVGYSLANPAGLVVWEAQFGDFVNGAQIVIDQFISSMRTKWDKTAPITMLLPHGQEGKGPEHSSCRPERLLRLCAQNNMIVAHPSTPSQLFHLLRRQGLSSLRIPLAILTPKKLLRQKETFSEKADLIDHSFYEILDDPTPADKTKTLILTSGKLFYELNERREKEGIKGATIIRIEQLYPLHKEKLETLLAKYGSFKKVVWAQEEPENMGAWSFLAPQLNQLIKDKKISVTFCGRPQSSSPASGSYAQYEQEQKEILKTAFED